MARRADLSRRSQHAPFETPPASIISTQIRHLVRKLLLRINLLTKPRKSLRAGRLSLAPTCISRAAAPLPLSCAAAGASSSARSP
eukprot:3230864-Pleurochrysis_carterae.AAC.1